MKDTGWTMLKKENELNFSKWGEYMKRAQIAERKVEKLKQLLLLTDPAVSSEEVNSLSVKQWSEFIRVFPDEGSELNNEGEK